VPPGRHLAEKFLYPKRVLYHISNCVFNFNFLAPVVSEITGGPYAPCGKILTQPKYLPIPM